MLNIANNVQNTPGFKGYLSKALNNPPYPYPQSRLEHDQNLLTIGTGAGMDLAITLKTVGNGVLLMGGAAVGALIPKKTLNVIHSIISGKSDSLFTQTQSLTPRMRGKAAMIGGIAAVGTANAASFTIRTLKAVLFPDKVVHAKHDESTPIDTMIEGEFND